MKQFSKIAILKFAICLLVVFTLVCGVPARMARAAGSTVLTSYADFNSAGRVFQNTFVREGDGTAAASIALQPQFYDDFSSGPLAPALWTAGYWADHSAYVPTFSGGEVTIKANNLAYIRSLNGFAQPTNKLPLTVEFSARFKSTPVSAEAAQNVGFGIPDLTNYYVVFSTFDPSLPAQNTGKLYAKVKLNDGDHVADLGTSFTDGSLHRYRIEWAVVEGDPGGTDKITFYIDGVSQAVLYSNNHGVNPTFPAVDVFISNKSALDALAVGQIQASPTYTASGTYTSPVLTAATAGDVFTTLAWDQQAPAGTSVLVETRSSVNGSYWTDYAAVSNGGQIPQNAHQIQARVTLTTTDPTVTSLVDALTFSSAAPQVDLNLVKTASAPVVALNADFQYTFSVTNNGPDSATGVTVSDTLPTGISYVSYSSTSWSCTGTTTISCVYTLHGGSLAAGETAAVSITVHGPGTVGSKVNSASVSSAAAETVPANNSSSVSTAFNVEADLSLSMSGSFARVGVGKTVLYTLHVTNLGPNGAQTVHVVDTVPAEMTISALNYGAGWSCSTAGQLVTCDLASLATGATSNDILISVKAPTSAASLVNNAVVSAATADLNSPNNSAAASTSVWNMNYLPSIRR